MSGKNAQSADDIIEILDDSPTQRNANLHIGTVDPAISVREKVSIHQLDLPPDSDEYDGSLRKSVNRCEAPIGSTISTTSRLAHSFDDVHLSAIAGTGNIGDVDVDVVDDDSQQEANGPMQTNSHSNDVDTTKQQSDLDDSIIAISVHSQEGASLGKLGGIGLEDFALSDDENFLEYSEAKTPHQYQHDATTDDEYANAAAIARLLDDDASCVEVAAAAGSGKLNLLDPSFETLDPNPDIRALFLQYDSMFFQNTLSTSAVEVKWSKRMTLCAGLCVYEGAAGLCSVRLSDPLLRLRPRSDLVNTLLHEMIHAYIFITANDRDHDAHGPVFTEHMRRINALAGTDITVYHNFHDEVNSYRTHVWRCDGSCQHTPPYYGYVRRAMNRAPGPKDYWWAQHAAKCSGTYHKISEPPKADTAKRPKDKPFGVIKHVSADGTVATVLKDAAVCKDVKMQKGSGTIPTGVATMETYFKPDTATPYISGQKRRHPMRDIDVTDNVADVVNRNGNVRGASDAGVEVSDSDA